MPPNATYMPHAQITQWPSMGEIANIYMQNMNSLSSVMGLWVLYTEDNDVNTYHDDGTAQLHWLG